MHYITWRPNLMWFQMSKKIMPEILCNTQCYNKQTKTFG